MPKYFLGVDGGQSSTTALIGDETGRVAGIGRAGPCNQDGAIQASLMSAFAQAGINSSAGHFASACLGFSGGPAGKESILREILHADRILVTDDAPIALYGATAGAPGLVVIAGTGSIAFGRNSLGQSARAGGWGYLFGDEGGGFWIVRQALRAALRFEEGWGAPTSLRGRLLGATRARSINDLMHRSYTAEFPRQRVAGFSILVNHAAEDGDPTALVILDEAARELATVTEAVRRQLFAADELVLVAYVGGVFHSRLLRSRFRDYVERAPGVRLKAPIYGPAVGALLQAYRAAGLPDVRISGFPNDD